MIIASLYSKPVNKSIAFHYGQKNNGYSAFTEYPLSRLPTPSDRCHNHNFWNYFLMSTRPISGGVCRAYVHAAVKRSLLLFILKLGRSLFKESLHAFFLILSTEAAAKSFCLKGTAGEHIKMISLVDTCFCHSYGYRSL